MSRTRLNLFIEPEHARRLDELATMKGLSKSSIVAAALASFLSPDSGDQREAAIAKRLDRLSRQFDNLERDQNILIETLALYVRYFLTVSTRAGSASGGGTRPGPRTLRAVHRTTRPASAARTQPGRMWSKKSSPIRASSSPSRKMFPPQRLPTNQKECRHEQRASRSGFVSLAGASRAHAAHGDGAGHRQSFEDPDVVEVMLNPDGSLWVDRLGSGREPLGVSLTPADGERIIRLVAAHVGAEVHAGKPLLSAELPETGERFEGALPPVTPGPVFALRKRAVGLIRLDAYVADGILTEAQAEFLRNAVRERQNILIAGGTSTGKTTLANALLDEVGATGDRVIVLEDTVELQCTARDHVPLRTRAGIVTMAELVRSTLRLRPDRIVVGEVRGAEALDLLKAWGTGHPGGIATVHAGSAAGALLRLEQLILEVAITPPRALIAEAVNVIVTSPVAAMCAACRKSPASSASTTTATNSAPSCCLPSLYFHQLQENRHDDFTHFRKTCLAIRGSRRAAAGYRRSRACRRLEHAVGGAAAIGAGLDPGTGGPDHRGDHHHCHRADISLR
jgi:type IV secretion system protein VirB11